jgi:preprotein translocase subunit SecY
MVSVAEQMAFASFSALARAGELRKRIWFTLGALIVYRLGTYIPTPGIDPVVMQQIFEQQAGGILGMFNMFAGGALGRMTIFALNVMPYISAAIIMQLLMAVSPTLGQLKKEGGSGRNRINRYTRYGTVLLAATQAYGIAVGLEGATSQLGSAVSDPGLRFRFTTVVTLTGGTIFLLWLGEQVTQRGIGNGISLIIFSGIVANLPLAIASTLELGRTGALSTAFILFLLIMAVALVLFIVFVERAQRRIAVKYPKRQVGNKTFAGEGTYLPMKLNPSGVIPLIFASSILLMPLTVAGFSGGTGPDWLRWTTAMLGRGSVAYLAVYVGLIVFFAFFYAGIAFDPSDTAENLKKHGGFVPGIRPGNATADHLRFVQTRLVAIGAIYLTLVAVLPEVLTTRYGVPFALGGTSLLIVVSVTMDTVARVQTHLLAHQYEGLVRKAGLKGGHRS